MVEKIDHICIAVKNLESALSFYEGVLGLKSSGIEVFEDEGIKTAFLMIGENKIEILEPINPESPIAKFVMTKGEGIHHISLKVNKDLQETLVELENQGVILIDKVPRQTSKGNIAFVHPKSTHGILLELL